MIEQRFKIGDWVISDEDYSYNGVHRNKPYQIIDMRNAGHVGFEYKLDCANIAGWWELSMFSLYSQFNTKPLFDDLSERDAEIANTFLAGRM
jgi:hypothetical protein